jgi:arginyl-tRNA synthetase
MQDVEQAIKQAIKAVFNTEVDVEVSRPAPEFGDWATNVALKLAKQLGQSPKEVADKLADYLINNKPSWLGVVTIAGPGFINLTVSDQVLLGSMAEILEKASKYGQQNTFDGQNVVVEYLDPNPMKELHIGHAYSGTIGDAIASLFEVAGAKVHRVTYQGDVGLHVGKAIYAILKRINNDPNQLEKVDDKPKFLGETYVVGAKAYEEDESAKNEIVQINKKVYERSDPLINQVYDTCKTWSMAYFDEAYKQFDFSPFEKNYMEGTVAKEGLKLVNEHLADGVFTESQGAVIFAGEKYGLHTRVFVNSQGLPTYEAKDLGNAMLKWQDYKYDRSIIITAEEQSDYFKVMLKALEQFAPEQAQKTTHIAHGLVKLTTGKMASRTGQVVKALDLLNTTEATAKKVSTESGAPVHDVALAAIKYAFLKNRIGGDIIYDVNESLSLEGNSGPYLQYAYARAKSILAKTANQPEALTDLEPDERALVVKISEFDEVVKEAIKQLAPHLICTYLYDLAQEFNRFYEKNRIIGNPREAGRLALAEAYATVLKNGLRILRIPTPERI